MLYKLAAICCQTLLVSAQQGNQLVNYEEMDALASEWGFKWEHHEVYTEEGWRLALHRIRAVKGVPVESDKPPLFIMHGAYDTDFIFLERFFRDPGLPGLLAEQGYDVWMGNGRGTPYSNYNTKDGTWSEEERWDFDWADMGRYDIPVFVDKIIEVAGKPKVTLMGYSEGNAQLFYALATN